MINQSLNIDIASELSRFDIHLNNNPRTIFSAKFGDGKTYFLRKYMQRESATALAVSPKQNVSKISSAFAQAVTDLSMHKTH